MSGTKHDKYLRLVPLVEAASDTSRRERILSLAANGDIRLYVPLRPGYVAYASGSLRPASVSGAASRIAITVPMQRLIDAAWRSGATIVLDPTPRPEIAFLALLPVHAQGLLEVARTPVCAHWFLGGLRHSSSMPGLLEAVVAKSQLCVRPAGMQLPHGPWLDTPDEYTFKIELRDVMLDDRVLRLAADRSYVFPSRAIVDAVSASSGSQAEHERRLTASELQHVIFEDVPVDDQPLLPVDTGVSDPYGLRERMPGVFHLFAASRHFFPEPNIKVEREKVVTWLRAGRWKDCTKLYNMGNARIAFKLINPDHKANQGASGAWEVKSFDQTILDSAYQKYQRDCFISQRLAVVIHAADRWLELLAENAPSKSTIPEKRMLQLIQVFRSELKKWGLSTTGERKVISDIVIWPVREVQLNQAIRPPKSR